MSTGLPAALCRAAARICVLDFQKQRLTKYEAARLERLDREFTDMTRGFLVWMRSVVYVLLPTLVLSSGMKWWLLWQRYKSPTTFLRQFLRFNWADYDNATQSFMGVYYASLIGELLGVVCLSMALVLSALALTSWSTFDRTFKCMSIALGLATGAPFAYNLLVPTASFIDMEGAQISMCESVLAGLVANLTAAGISTHRRNITWTAANESYDGASTVICREAIAQLTATGSVKASTLLQSLVEEGIIDDANANLTCSNASTSQLSQTDWLLGTALAGRRLDVTAPPSPPCADDETATITWGNQQRGCEWLNTVGQHTFNLACNQAFSTYCPATCGLCAPSQPPPLPPWTPPVPPSQPQPPAYPSSPAMPPITPNAALVASVCSRPGFQSIEGAAGLCNLLTAMVQNANVQQYLSSNASLAVLESRLDDSNRRNGCLILQSIGSTAAAMGSFNALRVRADVTGSQTVDALFSLAPAAVGIASGLGRGAIASKILLSQSRLPAYLAGVVIAGSIPPLTALFATMVQLLASPWFVLATLAYMASLLVWAPLGLLPRVLCQKSGPRSNSRLTAWCNTRSLIKPQPAEEILQVRGRATIRSLLWMTVAAGFGLVTMGTAEWYEESQINGVQYVINYLTSMSPTDIVYYIELCVSTLTNAYLTMLVYIAFTLKTVSKLHTLDTADGADISAARAQENCDVRQMTSQRSPSLVKSVMEQRDQLGERMRGLRQRLRARLGARRAMIKPRPSQQHKVALEHELVGSPEFTAIGGDESGSGARTSARKGACVEIEMNDVR